MPKKDSKDELFTVTNVTANLAELEEYISALITYIAHKKEEPHAAISAIPLERMNKKEFDRKDEQNRIDAPVSNEIDIDQLEAGDYKKGRELDAYSA